MKKTYKALVFDFDGTLADTITTITYYCNDALRKFGFPEIDKERYKYLVGNGYKNLVTGMLNEFDAYTDELFEKIAQYYYDKYEEDPLYLTGLYDGIEELIGYLKENGYRIAVLSNKPVGAVVGGLNAFFPEGTFDIIRGDDGMIDLKPAPGGLNKVIDDLGFTKEEIIYVGDTSTDMKTGKAADVFTVGCEWGFRTYDELKDNGADYIAKTPSDIIDFLKTNKK